MKFKSSIDRIVGKIPEEEKGDVSNEMSDRFETQYFMKDAPERPKSPEDLRLLELADQETNAVLAKYGIKPFFVPAKNIYVIDPAEWRRNGTSMGHMRLNFRK